MSLGEQVREARLAAELSQTGLGRLAGMDQGDISAIEKGSRRPGPDVLGRIADALGDERGPYLFDLNETSEEPREFSTDAPPRGKKTAPKKGAAPRHAKTVLGISLQEQLQFPYHLLGDMTAGRLPETSAMLHAQAPMCAAAWDQFLMRYPSIREKIESGMVATDVVMLIMAHLPIIQVARAEGQRLQQEQQVWDAGSASPAAA